MTSAAYLCHPAEHFLSSHGRLAMVMQASDALYSQLPALGQANVVINSRSGQTAEIIKLAETLKKEKIPFLAITNEPESPLAHLADHILWTNSHKDDLVSINIITAMMTATLILAAEILDLSDDIKPSLDRLPGLIKGAVDTAWQQADELLALFKDVSPIYLLHRGASKGAANCARLVIEEVARRPAIAMESGEFRQGPIEVVESGFGAMIYILPGAVGELNCRLADDIAIHAGGVYIIGDNALCGVDNVARISHHARSRHFPRRIGSRALANIGLQAGPVSGLGAWHCPLYLESDHLRNGYPKRKSLIREGYLMSNLNSRQRMLHTIQGQAADHIPCSFMSFAILRNKHNQDRLAAAKAELEMGWTPCCSFQMPPAGSGKTTPISAVCLYAFILKSRQESGRRGMRIPVGCSKNTTPPQVADDLGSSF